VLGLLLGGVSNPVSVVLFSLIGLLVGAFLGPIFSGFNRFYSAGEAWYQRALAWVLAHRPLMMGVLVGGIALTGVAFTSIPSGFVPVEDQGYAIGFVQAPDGGSEQNTRRINSRVAEIIRSEPEITTAVIISGFSLDGNAPNRGLFFVGAKNWDDRPNPDQFMDQIVERLNRKLSVIDGARIFVVEPPAIPGYGTSGGFEFQMLDQSGGALSLPEFFSNANQLIANALPTGLFSRVFTQFTPESPQLKVSVNREQLAALDVDYGQAMQAFSFYFGGAYINDTFQEGRIRRVFVQSDSQFRATPQQLKSLFVNSPCLWRRCSWWSPPPVRRSFHISTCSAPSRSTDPLPLAAAQVRPSRGWSTLLPSLAPTAWASTGPVSLGRKSRPVPSPW
jgi:HAE1 family hydrophobic/amphiphilic exporter-1